MILYQVGDSLCSRISATAAQCNPPSGSSSPGSAPQEWWADPWAGTEGPLAPSRTDPSCGRPPVVRVGERTEELMFWQTATLAVFRLLLFWPAWRSQLRRWLPTSRRCQPTLRRRQMDWPARGICLHTEGNAPVGLWEGACIYLSMCSYSHAQKTHSTLKDALHLLLNTSTMPTEGKKITIKPAKNLLDPFLKIQILCST